MEKLDHKTDPTKLWRTIKAIDGKSTPKAKNETIIIIIMYFYSASIQLPAQERFYE